MNQGKKYRLNLCLPMDCKDYLEIAAFKESSPSKRVSITSYIVKLIREDMQRRAK
jgi:hypothetical protein